MYDEIYVTDHARQRIKERCGVKSRKKAEHLCSIALNRGVQTDSAKGALKKWIISKSRPGSYITCYNDLAFVFSSKATAECITVLQLPPGISKDLKKMVAAS